MVDYRCEAFGMPEAGLRSGVRGHRLRPWQAQILQNWQLQGDSLVRRRGSTQQGTVVSGMNKPITGLHHFYSGTTSARLAAAGTKWFYKIGGDWTDSGLAVTATKYTVAAQYQGYGWIVNGTDTPQRFTPTTGAVTAWTTQASIIPQWVAGPYRQRLFYNDAANPHRVYYTGQGTPQTTDATSWLAVPDDQNGNFPRIGMMVGNDWIGCFGQEHAVNLSGASPLSFRTVKMPAGPGLVSWRTVVDMGGFVILMTGDGPMIWDGYGPLIPIDPRRTVDWSDVDYTTPEHCWAVRYHNKWILFYRSKAAAAASTQTSPRMFGWMAGISSALLGLFRRVGAQSQTSHFISYDLVTKTFDGPHTGCWLSGAQAQYRNSDRQELWLGHSGSAWGGVAITDQPDVYKDYDSSGTHATYDSIFRSGSCVDDTFERHIFRGCRLQFGTSDKGSVRARVIFNGLDSHKDMQEEVLSLSRLGCENPQQRVETDDDQAEGVWRRFGPDSAKKCSGYAPQLELLCNSDVGASIDSYSMLCEAAAGNRR